MSTRNILSNLIQCFLLIPGCLRKYVTFRCLKPMSSYFQIHEQPKGLSESLQLVICGVDLSNITYLSLRSEI